MSMQCNVRSLNHAQYVLIGSVELSRLQFAGKVANCTRSMSSNSHYGVNLWSEIELISVKHWKTTSCEADGSLDVSPL